MSFLLGVYGLLLGLAVSYKSSVAGPMFIGSAVGSMLVIVLATWELRSCIAARDRTGACASACLALGALLVCAVVIDAVHATSNPGGSALVPQSSDRNEASLGGLFPTSGFETAVADGDMAALRYYFAHDYDPNRTVSQIASGLFASTGAMLSNDNNLVEELKLFVAHGLDFKKVNQTNLGIETILGHPVTQEEELFYMAAIGLMQNHARKIAEVRASGAKPDSLLLKLHSLMRKPHSPGTQRALETLEAALHTG